MRERVRVEDRRSGCRGVLGVFLLAVGWVLAAPGCGAAFLQPGVEEPISAVIRVVLAA